jgi:hypothetical protein
MGYIHLRANRKHFYLPHSPTQTRTVLVLSETVLVLVIAMR